MKKMFRKMVSMISAMVITVSCSISAIRSMNTVDAKAMALDPIEEMAIKFNEARKDMGLDPLYITPYLNDIAQIRAEEQPVNYSHTRPDGTNFDSVINVDVVDYQISGEILAKGSDNVDAIFDAWKGSSTHWANITMPEATHVGIGLTYDYDNGNYYWAAIFVGMWDDSAPLEGERIPGTNAPGISLLSDDVPIADESVPGDVTMDGIVTVSDATLTLIAYTNESSGKESGLTEEQKIAADIDGDGKITGADATRILSIATELCAAK